VTVAERISGQPSRSSSAHSLAGWIVETDGTFTVKGVSAAAAERKPARWLDGQERWTHRGRDITGVPFDMKSGDNMSDVQVVLTPKVTTVSGQLATTKVDRSQTLPSSCFPAMQIPGNQGRFIRATRPDQQGQWRIKGFASRRVSRRRRRLRRNGQ